MLKEKLDSRKCFATAWGKLITEEEAYRQLNRQIAAMTANLFQVMRIFEPSWEKRTAAICDIANMMNMAVAGTPEEQKDYVNASLYEAFNIPELCEKSSWLGGITGDSGDEWENMAGRVVQFTRNRVEKELDTCPWDIVGSELCNMTTSMFTANFDLASAHGTENLDSYTSSARKIMDAATALFDRIIHRGLLVRRMYVVANHVVPEAEAPKKNEDFVQMDLFTDYGAQEVRQREEEAALSRERKLQEAALAIKKKYGKNALLKGMNLEEGATARTRNAQIGGHRA